MHIQTCIGDKQIMENISGYKQSESPSYEKVGHREGEDSRTGRRGNIRMYHLRLCLLGCFTMLYVILNSSNQSHVVLSLRNEGPWALLSADIEMFMRTYRARYRPPVFEGTSPFGRAYPGPQSWTGRGPKTYRLRLCR
jgi:hypothetical protein